MSSDFDCELDDLDFDLFRFLRWRWGSLSLLLSSTARISDDRSVMSRSTSLSESHTKYSVSSLVDVGLNYAWIKNIGCTSSSIFTVWTHECTHAHAYITKALHCPEHLGGTWFGFLPIQEKIVCGQRCFGQCLQNRIFHLMRNQT